MFEFFSGNKFKEKEIGSAFHLLFPYFCAEMKNYFKYLLLFVCLACYLAPLNAQKEGAIWYFGYGAGLDFTRHYPRPLTDGKLNTREGVASISDKDGNLLLYTDGTTIWNKLHQVMDNGSGLYGNITSTQSSMVVPKPGSTSVYYVFTVDEVGNIENPGHGLHYSVVDMTRSGGLGSVVEKNKDLSARGSRLFTEKITAVLHNNKEDYWIIAHGWGSDNDRFFIYELTKTGVRFVKSQVVGIRHENTVFPDMFNRGAVGYLKSSPKGDYLALAVESLKVFEIFRFDNTSGELTFLANLPAGNEDRPNEPLYAAYGVEFSPTSNYFYGSTREGGVLYRWDLSKNTEMDIRRSLEVIYKSTSNILCGALQLAFNGKIYITFSGQQFLGVINSPTQKDCNFQYQGASLIDNTIGEGGRGYYGLPTFLPDFFKAAEFYYENSCVNDTTLFYLSTLFGLGSPPVWTIMDEEGNLIDKANTNTTTMEGTYVFTTPGTYEIRLDMEQNGGPLSQTQTIVIHPLPEINFPDTTNLCEGSNVDLDAGDGAFYHWSDNINILERFRTISREGEYSVSVTHNNGCTNSDTTLVVSQPLPKISFVQINQAACGYQNGNVTIFMTDDDSNYIFDWKEFPDSSGNSIDQLSGGVYEVDIISRETGCLLNKKITVSEKDAPPITITPSISDTICPGQEIELTASGAVNYNWKEPADIEGATVTVAPMVETTYIVEGYSVDAEGRRCSGFQEITIPVYPYDPPQLGSDRSICEGTPLELDGGERFISWSWSNNTDERFITIEDSFDNLILVAEDINGCFASDTINLTFVPLPEVDLGPDRTICLTAPIELDAGDADSYLWNTGDTTRSIFVEESNIYEVAVSREGCSNTDQVAIQVNNPDSLKIDSVQTRDISCYGVNNGQIRIFVKGEGTNYQYSVDSGFTFVENGGLFDDLGPGEDYRITVWEDSACSIDYSLPITLTEPEEHHPLNFFVDSLNVQDVTCYGANNGQIVVFSHGEGLSYEYSVDNGLTYSRNDGIFNNLAPGQEYRVMVREDSVCTAIYPDPVVFSEPTEIIIDYKLTSPSCEQCDDGQILLSISGGIQPYSILWSNFDTTTRRINLPLGDYSVAVTDSSSCRVLKTITLDMGHGSMVIPNAFTPNDDGYNDLWTIDAIRGYPDVVVQVFDRFGKLVFESSPGYPEPWDGKFNGEYVSMGTYYFLIKLDALTKAMPGSLTVIR